MFLNHRTVTQKSTCPVVDVFAKLLASWWDRMTILVRGLLVEIVYIISPPKVLSTECAF